MATYNTSEGTKSDYIENLGQELGSLFHELWNEVVLLHSRWDEYVELFGTTSSRVELLNKAAPMFFKTVQDSLWESTLLHITRLTDPPKSCGKENLTLQLLPSLVEIEIKDNVLKKIEDVREKSRFCRDWRNRRIAHKDLGLVLNNQAEPLEPATRSKVQETLNGIADILNIVANHCMDTQLEFDVIKEADGAESLLYILDDGLKAEKERLDRIKSKDYLPKDFERKVL